jgi:hypothetical protein
MRRAKDRIYPMTLSATASVKAPGVLKTRMPNRSASCRSMESTPVPHLEMTFRRGAKAPRATAVKWSSPQITPSTAPAKLINSGSVSLSCTEATTRPTAADSKIGRNRSRTGIR